MTRQLLWRGMLAGLLAAFAAATFALAFAEPRIDAAIAVEARHAMPDMPEDEVVSRATQKGAGLYTAMMVYGTALGGLFAIVFAGSHRRVGGAGPYGRALLLALAAFVVIVVVAAIVAGWAYQRTAGRWSSLDGFLMAGGVYVALVTALQAMLPAIDEVPPDFPATLLWQFRLAAIATQGVFWLVAGDMFGRLAERLMMVEGR